jgi:hypothetical protein
VNEIYHIYKRPDVHHVFLWEGGGYIEVFGRVRDLAAALDNDDAICTVYPTFGNEDINFPAFPVEVINVWDYENNVSRIHLEQDGPYDDSDFEAACVSWLVENDFLPFWCRVSELDVDDLIDIDVSV